MTGRDDVRRFSPRLRAFATVCLVAACATSAAAAADAAPEAFVHEAGAVRFTVTREGLSRVEVGGRRVAEGGWYAWDAGPGWFGRGEMGPAAPPHGYGGLSALFDEKSLEVVGPDHARVTHARPGVRATTDYRFADGDVRIVCRLEHRAEDGTIHRPAMGGLRFDFGQPPGGRLPCWHHSYLQAAENNIFHPNHNNQIGGTWGVGEGFGVGTSPAPVRMVQTLTHWEYGDWNERAQGPVRWLAYFRRCEIPPGGAMRLGLRLRVSTRTDWRHLLAPYKAFFRETCGRFQYDTTDNRPIVMACINHSQRAIGKDNPYGFHGGHRRVDLAKGARAFADETIRILKAARGQGTLIWGLSGDHPRGAMYRPDFDCLPEEVLQNWPTIVRRYQEAGLKIGVCTRPRHIPWPETYHKDTVVDLNPADPRHLELLWKRFKTMIDRGCTLFYLDSFGSAFVDVQIMRYLRRQMGPGIQTYAEHPCDAIAPLTGFYTETDAHKDEEDGRQREVYQPRTSLRFLEICRWLLDGPVPAVSRGGPVAWRFEHQITPLLPDYGADERFRAVGDLVTKHQDRSGRWRMQPLEP